MKTLDVKQGSPEWLHARLGLPTASNFDRIISPVKMKESSAQGLYAARLAAEWFLGFPLDDDDLSKFTQRGEEMEERAISFYEAMRGVDTSKVGLCLTDDGEVGASPDRLVGDDGLLEMKCPSAEHHMGNWLDEREFALEHRCQCQGQLYVTGRQWVDLVSFHEILPKVCVRVERDTEFMVSLSFCLEKFRARLDAAKARLADKRDARLKAIADAMAEEGDGQELLI